MASAIKGSVTSALGPHFESSQIKLVNVDLEPVGVRGKLAFLLENVFTPNECDKLIQVSEEFGYKEAMINYADGKAVLAPGYRDGQRVMIDDPEFSKILFQRISTFLPQEFQEKHLVEINERLRFLKYHPGDKFAPHNDGTYHRDSKTRTYITLQIYLNEGFEGGATTFLDFSGNRRVPIVPKIGMILVFQHNIYHEGSIVNAGTKYTIRTDVLYRES